MNSPDFSIHYFWSTFLFRWLHRCWRVCKEPNPWIVFKKIFNHFYFHRVKGVRKKTLSLQNVYWIHLVWVCCAICFGDRSSKMLDFLTPTKIRARYQTRTLEFVGCSILFEPKSCREIFSTHLRFHWNRFQSMLSLNSRHILNLNVNKWNEIFEKWEMRGEKRFKLYFEILRECKTDLTGLRWPTKGEKTWKFEAFLKKF